MMALFTQSLIPFKGGTKLSPGRLRFAGVRMKFAKYSICNVTKRLYVTNEDQMIPVIVFRTTNKNREIMASPHQWV